jgi:hypothetical protein
MASIFMKTYMKLNMGALAQNLAKHTGFIITSTVIINFALRMLAIILQGKVTRHRE